MKILIVGGGGREHALVWKLAADSCRPELFCAPGNAGTAELATNLDIKAEDLAGLLKWAADNRPDLTVVGPEAPLCMGLTDMFESEGLSVFGPSKAAARIEGSKAFAKDVMETAGVPTARAKTFTDAAQALEYARMEKYPLVVKADGLAAGKGVVVCARFEEAEAAIRQAMVQKIFGEAGNKVVVEECLAGEEASILALVDGENALMLASAQDHKRIYDNDLGPNTGGMGAYSPAPVINDEMWPAIREMVFERTLGELRKRGIVYKGVLYAGVMRAATGLRVLEFNCRFGDPETQVILPRIGGDLAPLLSACVDGTLKGKAISWRGESCVCVVMASGGYPGNYEKGKVIEGIKRAEALKNVVVFHAGTKHAGALADGRVVTAGGRVLGVTALGADLKTAVNNAYSAVSRIKFDQAHYRTDIAARALA